MSDELTVLVILLADVAMELLRALLRKLRKNRGSVEVTS